MKHLAILLLAAISCAETAGQSPEIPLVIQWKGAGAPPGIPGGPSLYIADASAPYWPNTLVLAISAFDLGPIKSVSGIIRYKSSVLAFKDWSRGRWFNSGADTHTWTVRSDPGEIRFRLNRYEAVSGDGEILLLHFVLADDGTGHRSTTVGWEDPQVNGYGVAALGGAVVVN